MANSLPTEFFLGTRPGTVAEVEYLCALAARSQGDAVAVAVAPSNVARAANLLFGTGIGVVSQLDENHADQLINEARWSVATGAAEIALPRLVLDNAASVMALKSVLGASTPLTIDVTTEDGAVSLDHAEHALVLGADYVAFGPTDNTTNPAAQTAYLVALASELQLGGVKVSSGLDHHLVVLNQNEWAQVPGNARRCRRVEAPAA